MLSTEQTVTYNASNVHIIPYRIYYSLDKETIYTGIIMIVYSLHNSL